MHYVYSFITALAVAAPFTSAAHVVPHDQVHGFAESTQNEKDGALQLRFKPFLNIQDGCVPFPAADGNGGVRYVSIPSKSSWPEKDLPQ